MITAQVTNPAPFRVTVNRTTFTVEVTAVGIQGPGGGGSGSGDVEGPPSSVDNQVAAFDGVTGKLLKDGGATVAQIRSRATHTGEQAISTVTDLQTELNGKAASSHTHAVADLNVSASGRVLGRSTAGAGFAEEITCTAAGRALIDDADATAQRATLGLGALSTLATVGTSQIDNDAVTYAKIQNVSATDKVLGRSTAGAGDVEEIACTAAGRAILDDADATAQRTTLGLGTAATQASSAFQSADGTLTALAAHNTNGLLTQTAADTFTGRTLTGTSNEVSITNGDGVSGNPTVSLPSTIDLGGKTSFEIPNGTSPTVDAAGEIAIDTNADGNLIDQGLIVYHDGVQKMFCVAVDALPSTDDHVLAYDATADKFVFQAQAGGGGGGGVDPLNIPFGLKRCKMVEFLGSATNSFGMTIGEGGGSNVAATGSTGGYRRWTTSATIDTNAYWVSNSASDKTSGGTSFDFRTKAQLEAITTVRVWIGLCASSVVTIAATDTAPVNTAAFRFSTSASDTNWQFITADNVSVTTTDSGVAGGTTLRSFRIVEDAGAGNIKAYIDGNLVATHSTNLPAANTQLNMLGVVQTLAASTRYIQSPFIACFSNF